MNKFGDRSIGGWKTSITVHLLYW